MRTTSPSSRSNGTVSTPSSTGSLAGCRRHQAHFIVGVPSRGGAARIASGGRTERGDPRCQPVPELGSTAGHVVVVAGATEHEQRDVGAGRELRRYLPRRTGDVVLAAA